MGCVRAASSIACALITVAGCAASGVRMCNARLQGRAYVALGEEVFLLPDPGPAASAPKSTFFFLSGKPVVQPTSPAATPIAPPDRSEAPGCVGNPLQLQTVVVDTAKLLGSEKAAGLEPINPADQLSLAVGRIDSLSVHGSLSRVITPEESQYVDEQRRSCDSMAGRASMDNDVHGCFYRPFGRPDQGWTGSYAAGLLGSMTIGDDAPNFDCEPSETDFSLTTCRGLTVKPEIDLTLTWINVKYVVTFEPATRAALLETMLDYDRAVRASLVTAHVADYRWPARALAAWRKRQPTAETISKLGTPLSALIGHKNHAAGKP